MQERNLARQLQDLSPKWRSQILYHLVIYSKNFALMQHKLFYNTMMEVHWSHWQRIHKFVTHHQLICTNQAVVQLALKAVDTILSFAQIHQQDQQLMELSALLVALDTMILEPLMHMLAPTAHFVLLTLHTLQSEQMVIVQLVLPLAVLLVDLVLQLTQPLVDQLQVFIVNVPLVHTEPQQEQSKPVKFQPLHAKLVLQVFMLTNLHLPLVHHVEPVLYALVKLLHVQLHQMQYANVLQEVILSVHLSVHLPLIANLVLLVITAVQPDQQVAHSVELEWHLPQVLLHHPLVFALMVILLMVVLHVYFALLEHTDQVHQEHKFALNAQHTQQHWVKENQLLLIVFVLQDTLLTILANAHNVMRTHTKLLLEMVCVMYVHNTQPVLLVQLLVLVMLDTPKQEQLAQLVRQISTH
jgi:hypothetical protein